MFVGAGVGAYGFAMFHLVTHAFFKALLFLAAGIVIHHLHGEQDIRQDGRAARSMPFTHATFLIGTLALVGIPPLAGFWSKDAILASALDAGRRARLDPLRRRARRRAAHRPLLAPALLRRLPRRAAHARRRARGRARRTTAKGPRSMIVPVGVLAVGSAVAGLLADPRRLAPVRGLARPRRRAARPPVRRSRSG